METILVKVGDQDWCDECDIPRTIVEMHTEEIGTHVTYREVEVYRLDCDHEIIIPLKSVAYPFGRSNIGEI